MDVEAETLVLAGREGKLWLDGAGLEGVCIPMGS